LVAVTKEQAALKAEIAGAETAGAKALSSGKALVAKAKASEAASRAAHAALVGARDKARELLATCRGQLAERKAAVQVLDGVAARANVAEVEAALAGTPVPAREVGAAELERA